MCYIVAFIVIIIIIFFAIWLDDPDESDNIKK
jgi:hypothetical protein